MSDNYQDQWDEAEGLAEKYEGGDFRNLKDHDDFVVGAVRGGPRGREQHWDNDKRESRPCTGDGCVDCESGFRKNVRYWLNFFTTKYGTGERVAGTPNKNEVLEISRAAFKAMLVVKKKYGLRKYLFEFRRNGAKGDKETTFSVLPDTPFEELDPSIVDAINSVDLVDLKELEERIDGGGSSGSSSGGGSSKPSGEALISPAVVGELSGELKALGLDKTLEILKELGVKKVSLTKESQEQELRAMIAAASGDDDAFS